MGAVQIRRHRSLEGYVWKVRANGATVAIKTTGKQAIKYVHVHMTDWYVKDAATQQFRNRMMAGIMQGKMPNG